jgi:hypothetical protein
MYTIDRTAHGDGSPRATNQFGKEQAYTYRGKRERAVCGNGS